MISHVVLVKPRSDLSEADRIAFLDAFDRALHEIPQVRGVRVGRRLRHGAGYEQTAPDVDFVAIIDFDDLRSLQAYLRHPAHQELGVRLGDTMSTVMVYDVAVGGGGDFRP